MAMAGLPGASFLTCWPGSAQEPADLGAKYSVSAAIRAPLGVEARYIAITLSCWYSARGSGQLVKEIEN